MDLPKVSVLVPVYGVEKFISRCAESIFSQSYHNLEYIFVNDATPDKSIILLEEVVERFPERKNQVSILHHERNRGLAAARNTALDAASGDFVFWVDSDDWVEENAILSFVNQQLKTNADIICGWTRKVTKKGISPLFEPRYKNKQDMMGDLFCYGYGHTVWGKLIRRSLYEDFHVRCLEGVNMGEDACQVYPLVYYAETVASLEEYVYNYNQLNENSYSYDVRNKSNIIKWRQTSQTVHYLEQFFSNKEKKYQIASHEFAALYLISNLRSAARNKEKGYYLEMRDLIRDDYKDCYDVIGLKYSMIRGIYFNYSLLCLLIHPVTFVLFGIITPFKDWSRRMLFS